MRHAAALLVLLPLLACGRREAPSPEPADREETFSVPVSENLAGREVEAVEEGPWRLRRIARAPSPAERAGEGGGFGGPGAPPPTGSPAPEPAPGGGAPATLEMPAEDAEGSDGGRGERLREERAGSGGGRPGQSGSPLRAGSTDDNEDFQAFLAFLAAWSDREGVAERYDALDVSDRRFVAVTDAGGRPLPAARVHLVDEAADRVVWEGTTYGDGRVPFYPRAAGRGLDVLPATEIPPGGWLVEVRHGEQRRRLRWDGEGEVLKVTLDRVVAPEATIRLDVGFLIDTTGSMGDEIDRIKQTLLSVTARLGDLALEFDLRYGAVLYRDLGDAYVTKTHPFTRDLEAFDEALQAVRAQGGGDGPESLNQGLAEAVGRLDWREGAARVLFLVADAPPHMDYEGDVPYGTSLLAAVARGIRIHSVAASGLDDLGSLVFRQVAQFTRGKFVFIEYGSTRESADRHGVAGAVRSNNLDDILYEQIEAELARWGRGEPTPAAPGAVEASATERVDLR